MSVHVFGSKIRLWGNLPEHKMRVASLERYFAAVSAPTSVRAIEELVVGARMRAPGATPLYLAFVDLIENNWEIQAELHAWRRAAFRSGSREISYLLTDPDAVRAMDPDEEQQPHPDLQELTLGERKSRARLSDSKGLDRFLTESDPAVIRIVLEHPKTTVKWMIRLLARRPQSADILATVFQVPKWLALPEIQSTICQNPYVRARHALRILPLLPREELQEISRSRELHGLVNEYAASLAAMQNYADFPASTDSAWADDAEAELSSSDA